MYNNFAKLEFDSNSYNEGFARMATVAFLAPIDPTLEVLSDVKTAISEAITNCIIHGYENTCGTIFMNMYFNNNIFRVEIIDNGVGIEDIDKAMEPMFTTKSNKERSGMGFCFMEAFMDELRVDSTVGKGTKIVMKKVFNREEML